jgi:two-component system NtrC family sensor kinase
VLAEYSASGALRAVGWIESRGVFAEAIATGDAARATLNDLYLVLTLALVGAYGLIAVTLEVFVLPRQVYEPIERLRRADDAVQRGDESGELIPEAEIPSDELGEIMRTRNASIVTLRAQERQLSEALDRLERIAGELKRKNDLLEMARRNLEDQDRLASLGMMSAGIAHELNTPLAVIKGSVEEMRERGGTLAPERVALLTRVVGRLERLGDSLLDFARIRPPAKTVVLLWPIVEEAWTLVRLDRGARDVAFTNAVPADMEVFADADRLTQVLVNLVRNAVDAFDPRGGAGTIEVGAREIRTEGRAWVSLTIRDDGPGIDPEVLGRLFEPFASTRMDSTGTGLGLAVAEGIVREHGGVIVARNLGSGTGGHGTSGGGGAGGGDTRGAEFEVLVPKPEPELMEQGGGGAEGRGHRAHPMAGQGTTGATGRQDDYAEGAHAS